VRLYDRWRAPNENIPRDRRDWRTWFADTARLILGLIILFAAVVSILALATWAPTVARLPWTLAEQWAENAKSQDGVDRVHLCLLAEACQRYSDARLQCATAGNFETCLRIKMDDDRELYKFADECSGGEIGAPPIRLSQQTPQRFICKLLRAAQ
jgi:hypothetical protein